MDQPPDATSLFHHFAVLKDPRQRAKVVHPLPEILLLVLCATIVGADDFVEVQHWGGIHIDFLRRLLPYKDGIPSHDALNDLMNALNPSAISRTPSATNQPHFALMWLKPSPCGPPCSCTSDMLISWPVGDPGTLPKRHRSRQ